MPTFNSLGEIEAWATQKMSAGVRQFAENVFDFAYLKMTMFYGEYSPKQYDRTMNFMDTIDMFTAGGNPSTAEIKWTPVGYSTGKWSAGRIMGNNLGGNHGNAAQGNNIIRSVLQEATEDKLANAIRAAGLPIS